MLRGILSEYVFAKTDKDHGPVKKNLINAGTFWQFMAMLIRSIERVKRWQGWWFRDITHAFIYVALGLSPISKTE